MPHSNSFPPTIRIRSSDCAPPILHLPKQGEKKFLPPDYEEFEGESQAQEPGTAGSGDASTGEDDPTGGNPLLKIAHVPEHITESRVI